MTTLSQARRALLEIKARADSHLIAGYIDTIGEYLDSQVPLTIEKRIPGQPLTGEEFHTMYGASIDDVKLDPYKPGDKYITGTLKIQSPEDLTKLRESLTATARVAMQKIADDLAKSGVTELADTIRNSSLGRGSVAYAGNGYFSNVTYNDIVNPLTVWDGCEKCGKACGGKCDA